MLCNTRSTRQRESRKHLVVVKRAAHVFASDTLHQDDFLVGFDHLYNLRSASCNLLLAAGPAAFA